MVSEVLQIISTRIPADYVDIALIRKCNTIDLPDLQSASKTCEKLLLKYLSFPGVGNSYCDRICALLDSAESWALHIVQAYTNAEVHSIKGSPGDIADIGVFSDNADKTIFEFLESFELGYIDWGNNRQRASKLSKHLSDNLNSVTSKFNKYDLSEICAEFTSLSDPNQSVPPLSKYVGGSEVHQLLGIKNTNLDPVWIKTLPNGVAVYQSVFKDIWGSDLIFEGPHKRFTDVNKSSNINQIIFGIHSVISDPEYDDESWTDE